MRRPLIALLLLVVACSSPAQPTPPALARVSPSVAAKASPQPTTAASPTNAPVPVSPTAGSVPCAPVCVSQSLLFAALETSSVANQWDTVVIAGLYGGVRAQATFTPMPTPYVGCAGAVLPASAQVAAGKVYFANGTGSIGSLSADGAVTQITKFPLTSSQQMLSFAVSPDGSRLLAAIFTLPPKPASSDVCNGATPVFAPGAFTLDVYSAQAGGVSQLVSHQVLATSATTPLPNVMAFVGWNALGPFGTYPTEWATQGGGPTHYFGVPVRIDAVTGKVLGPVSDLQSCRVWDIASSGDYVCTPSGGSNISVRHPDGTEIWGTKSETAGATWVYDLLSPKEGRVVSAAAGSEVFCRGVCNTKLPSNFGYSGWLDDTTLIGDLQGGTGFDGDLAFLSLDVPAAPVDLGIKGLFVGTVRT